MAPNAAGAATATVFIGASAPEDGVGAMAVAATGAAPVVVCVAPVVAAGTPNAEPSGMRVVDAAEGVADAVDAAANALPDEAKDAAAGDTGVRCTGCDPVALKDVPVDAGAVAAATVGADAKGCAVAGPEAPAADVRAEAAAAAFCAAAKGCAVVMPANAGAAATGVLFGVFAGTGAAEPDALPTGDDASAAEVVCAPAKGSADNGFDHDAEEAAASTDAGCMAAAAGVTVAAAAAAAGAGGVARCMPAGNGAVSLPCFAAACQTVPVTAPAGAVFDAAEAAVVAAATGTASARGCVGVAAIDEAERGGGVTGWTGFTTSCVACACSSATTDTAVSASAGACDWTWPAIPAAVAASFASTVRPVALTVDVTAAEGVPTAALAATDSSASDGGAAIGLSCGAPSLETGGLTMSSQGAKSIGASNAGAAGASAPCRCSRSA
ncbi:hypothetical protein [Burkholderia sp. Bp9131]|uniref:hypothetical protein n=1 Tax=Burkholderia sp. Bp9131 TaxID=2184571 RepID=UPI00390897CF